jgi:hypothetical protein
MKCEVSWSGHLRISFLGRQAVDCRCGYSVVIDDECAVSVSEGSPVCSSNAVLIHFASLSKWRIAPRMRSFEI